MARECPKAPPPFLSIAVLRAAPDSTERLKRLDLIRHDDVQLTDGKQTTLYAAEDICHWCQKQLVLFLII